MTRIYTNVSSLIAQQSLQNSNTQLQSSLTQLSTGLRINTGADDPSGLIASQALQGDITNTQQAVSNSQQASQMISTADSALGQMSSLLDTITGLVNQAASGGTMSAAEIAANQSQIDSSLDALNRIANTTTFQGQNLLNGNLAFTTTAGANYNKVSNLQINQADLGSTGKMTVGVNITQAALQATLNTAVTAAGGTPATATITTPAFSDAGTITLTAPGAGTQYNGVSLVLETNSNVAADAPQATYNASAKILTVQINDTVNTTDDAIAAAINTQTSFTATASDAGAGTDVVAVGASAGAGVDVVDGTPLVAATLVGGGSAGGLQQAVEFQLTGAEGSQVFSFNAGTTAAQMAAAIQLDSDTTGVGASTTNTNTLVLTSTDYGSAASVNVDVLSGALDNATKNSANATATTANGTDIAATVNGMTATGAGNTLSVDNSNLSMAMTVAPTTVGNIGFNITGGGAVFQIGPTVTTSQQARLGIQSVNTSNLGGVDGTLYNLGSGGTASLATDPTKAAAIVTEAASQITSLRGRLGAFQQATLDTNINSLNDAVTNLTSAQSSIQDADFATESAALTRAQVLVQSGTAVLSIANHLPDNVLSLLKQ